MFFAKNPVEFYNIENFFSDFMNKLLKTSMDYTDYVSLGFVLNDFAQWYSYGHFMIFHVPNNVVQVLRALTSRTEKSFKLKGQRYFTIRQDDTTMILVHVIDTTTNEVICMLNTDTCNSDMFNQIVPLLEHLKVPSYMWDNISENFDIVLMSSAYSVDRFYNSVKNLKTSVSYPFITYDDAKSAGVIRHLKDPAIYRTWLDKINAGNPPDLSYILSAINSERDENGV